MNNLLFYGGTFWIAGVILATDMILPSGVAVGLGYIVPVIAGLWSPWPRFVFVAAGLCTLLTALGFFISPISGELWEAMTNRVLSVIVLWVSAVLCAERIRLKIYYQYKENEKPADW